MVVSVHGVALRRLRVQFVQRLQKQSRKLGRRVRARECISMVVADQGQARRVAPGVVRALSASFSRCDGSSGRVEAASPHEAICADVPVARYWIRNRIGGRVSPDGRRDGIIIASSFASVWSLGLLRCTMVIVMDTTEKPLRLGPDRAAHFAQFVRRARKNILAFQISGRKHLTASQQRARFPRRRQRRSALKSTTMPWARR